MELLRVGEVFKIPEAINHFFAPVDDMDTIEAFLALFSQVKPSRAILVLDGRVSSDKFVEEIRNKSDIHVINLYQSLNSGQNSRQNLMVRNTSHEIEIKQLT